MPTQQELLHGLQSMGWLLSPLGLGLLGLCVGSFLNVVIHRMPLMMERAWKLEGAEMLGMPFADKKAQLIALRNV